VVQQRGLWKDVRVVFPVACLTGGLQKKNAADLPTEPRGTEQRFPVLIEEFAHLRGPYCPNRVEWAEQDAPYRSKPRFGKGRRLIHAKA